MEYRNGSAENPQISVIIPARNEAQGIGSIIGRVQKVLKRPGTIMKSSWWMTGLKIRQPNAPIRLAPRSFAIRITLETGQQ